MPRVILPFALGGGSVANGTLTSSGAATASFVGAALDATTLTSSGAATASFVGAIAGSVLAASGAGSASFVGAAQAAGALTSAGAGAAALVGASSATGTLTSSGAATGSFVGSSVIAGQTALVAAGAATVAFAGSSLAASSLAATGAADARFVSPQAANETTGGYLPTRRRRRDEYEFLDPYRWRVGGVDEPEQAQAAQKVIKKRVKTLEGWKADLAAPEAPAPAAQAAAPSSSDMAARDVQRWIDEYNRIAAEYRDREIALRLRQEVERRQFAERKARRERQDIEFLLLAA